MLSLIRISVVAFIFFLPTFFARAQTDAAIKNEGPKYPQGGFSASSRIGSELYNALKPKFREQVHVQPVALETDLRPFVKTEEYPDEEKPMRLVFISIGFLELINYIAHAKAIDTVEPGYFQTYLASLAQESGSDVMKEPPNISDKKYWTEEVMNEQLSNFNQMAGMVLAIEISHHYLGHFKKYGTKTEGNDLPTPINNLLTPAEWDDSVDAGVQNALDCGYGVEGVKALYDGIDKMTKRPAWTSYFLPQTVKVEKLKKNLEKAEKKYFGQ